MGPPGRLALLIAWSLIAPVADAAAAAKPADVMLPATSGHAAVAICAPDLELVQAHVGLNATARDIRKRLFHTGAPAAKLDATHEVLVRDLAAALRSLASVPGTLDNVTALRLGLEAKGEPYAMSESAAALLERLEGRLEKECFVVNARRPLAMSLALEDLQAAAAERMLTASGSRIELLDRLYHFQQRCDRMVRAASAPPRALSWRAPCYAPPWRAVCTGSLRCHGFGC